MQEQKYAELEERALGAEKSDAIRQLEARAIIHQQIEAMRSEGKALTLSDEELRLLESFRHFRLRMRKAWQTFTWLTRKPEEVQLATETAEIVHPSEA